MLSLCPKNNYRIEGISCQLHQWGLFLGESYNAHLNVIENPQYQNKFHSNVFSYVQDVNNWRLVNIHATYMPIHILLYIRCVWLYLAVDMSVYVYWDCQKV